MAPDPRSPINPIPVSHKPVTLPRSVRDVGHFVAWNALFGGVFLAMSLAAFVAFTGAGCTSTPSPDPDHGVSNASYRDCLTRTDTNLTQIVSKLTQLRDEDRARPLAIGGPRHSEDWWDAELREAIQTQKLVEATLSGSNVPAPSPLPTLPTGAPGPGK